MTRNCRGHALTEFLAVSAVLVPLLLLVPVVGKLQDLRHAVQMGSRTAAFDATLHHPGSAGWKSPAQLADEVRARHFGGTDTPVLTAQQPDVDDRKPLWTDPLGRPLVPDLGAVRIGFGPASSPDPDAGFQPAGDGRPFSLNPLAAPARLGLATPGLFSADVSVPIARMPDGLRALQPLDRLDLTLQARTSLLLDGWTANAPGQVDARVERLAVPGGGAVRSVADLGGLGITLLELGRVSPPRIGELEAWRDAVPADRLRTGAQP
jgi:hypothetical protein